MKCAQAFVTFTLALLRVAEGINTCDQSIIDSIRTRNGCPEWLLKSLHDMSNFTYVYSPHNTVPDTVQCAQAGLDHLRGNTAQAHVYAEYKDQAKPDFVQNYVHEEVSCGLIKETDESSKVFLIYPVFAVEKCFCYYRCTPYKTEGDSFASCAVPIAHKDQKQNIECCEHCRQEVAQCGVETLLDKISTCNN